MDEDLYLEPLPSMKIFCLLYSDGNTTLLLNYLNYKLPVLHTYTYSKFKSFGNSQKR